MPSEHMHGQHALLSPSAAERWLSCPASIRVTRDLDTSDEDAVSAYAAEGTAAHALAELQARTKLVKHMQKDEYSTALSKWRSDFGQYITDEAEMFKHAHEYVELLRQRLAANPGSVLMLEQRVPTGVPSCWGTSDAVIVSSTVVEIIDYKYGKGVEVQAAKNPQLKLYAVGALEAFGDLLGVVEHVRYTVFQPRINHTDTEELTADALRAWRDDVVIPIAEKALGPDAEFGPSEEACRWCPVKGNCRAYMEWSTELDFGMLPNELDDDELIEALERIPAIEAWCAAVRDYALDRVYSKGEQISGYKVVRSQGKRSVPDQEGAIEALEMIGYSFEQIGRRSLKTIGDLEKLMGKQEFADTLAAFISKGEGKPSLVPEDDPRPSIQPNTEAAKEFNDE